MLSNAEVETMQQHVDAIQKILDKNKKVNSRVRKDSAWFQNLIDQGAIFYAGHGYEITDNKITVSLGFGYVMLSDKMYECYSNGCVSSYSLPPHTDKIHFSYDIEIPNKTGYYY
jgi:hypothetical protein